jgi:hypothetical protein
MVRISSLIFILLAGSAVFAQEENTVTTRLDQLESEIRELKAAQEAKTLPVPPAPAPPPAALTMPQPGPSISGLSAAVSKIYGVTEPAWIVGLSANFFSYTQQNGFTNGVTNRDRMNVGTVAPALSVRLSKRLVFVSQFLFENGGAEASGTVTLQKGQTVVQMAYIDWLASDYGHAGVRLGHQLIPIGTVNSSEDPTTYLGVLRPELETALIPSSWHENGISVWAEHERASVQAGIFNSLDASGFRAGTFLAGGRNQGQNAAAEDMMGVLRVSTRAGFATAGFSTVFGNSAQKSVSLQTGGFQVGEFHLALNPHPRTQFLVMWAQGDIQDAASISVVNSQSIAEQARGYYAQGAYDLLGGTRKLWAFVRYTHYNLDDHMPDGYNADPLVDVKITTTGLSYQPNPNVVFKMDYESKRTGFGHLGDQFNLGAGLIF